MKCHSKKIADSGQRTADSRKKLNAIRYTLNAKPAFTLIETLTALAILAIVSSSVLVVINRCMASAADSAQRYHAFEVARENMEKLLSRDSVEEMVEYGSSDNRPEVQWQTTVEVFYEPITERMWIQAICSAEYTDTDGESQTVELTHWLTDLTKSEVIQIIEEKQKEKEWLAEQIIETEEDAADYAGVDVRTIQQWVENGMPLTDDGGYIRAYLDLYKEYNGSPTTGAISQVVEAYGDLLKPAEEPGEHEPEEPDKPQDKPEDREKEPEREKTYCGYTWEEIMQWNLMKIIDFYYSCPEFQ